MGVEWNFRPPDSVGMAARLLSLQVSNWRGFVVKVCREKGLNLAITIGSGILEYNILTTLVFWRN